MINLLFAFSLGCISLIINKEYIEIFMVPKPLSTFKKRVFWFIILIFALLFEYRFSIPLLNFIGNAFVVFCIMITMYDDTIRKKILLSILATTLWICSKCIIIYLFALANLSNTNTSLQSSILAKLIMFLLTQIISKIVDIHYGNIPSIRIITARLSVPVSSLFISLTLLYAGNTIASLYGSLNIFISCILILFLNLNVFNTYDKLLGEECVSKKDALYQKELEMYQSKIQQELSEMQYIRHLKHDLKSHLFLIREYAQNKDYKAIINSIDNLLNDNLSVNYSIVSTGNTILDNFLNLKLSYASTLNIHVTVDITIPNNLFISLDDLLVVLGNALDNAIENTSLISPSERGIVLSMLYKKNCLKIGVKNTFNGYAKKNRFGEYQSTKIHSKNHGLGLSSIKKVTEKYNGELLISNDEKYFYTLLTLYEK